MGTNGGNGMANGPGHDGGGVIGNGAGQPLATEYTLQGVMRFLQTEWHRHERDRNAWEIERQEMRSRIAMLEGAGRRSDATQRALRKYVVILEQKVKHQSALLKAGKGETDEKSGKFKHANKPETVREPDYLEKYNEERAALLEEKLRVSMMDPSGSATDIHDPDLQHLVDDELARGELKNFLDRCQAEFMYLMVTPANPLPPRESPLLPIMDLREGEPFRLPGQPALDHAFPQPLRPQHNHAMVRDLMSAHVQQGRPAPSAGNHQPSHVAASTTSLPVPAKHTEAPTQPMMRTSNTDNASGMYGSLMEWPHQVSVNGRLVEEAPGPCQSLRPLARSENGVIMSAQTPAAALSDNWDFNDGAFPDPAAHVPQVAQPMSNRPDTDVFPTAESLPKSPDRSVISPRRKTSTSMTRRWSAEHELSLNAALQKAESGNFKFRYGLRGHLDTVRTVIFSGGGSPGEPEICTAGDDGMIKRFHIPDRHIGVNNSTSDLDVTADFTHRGHSGAVLCLASWSPSPNFTTGGRAQGDGWIFSGGQDSSIRVWERGRVDPKSTIDAHTDAVWALCVLPATLGSIFGPSNTYGSSDRILLASGAADGTVKVWALSAPPHLTSPQPGSGRRGPGGRVRGNSMSSGSAFPTSPQPNTASNSPFHHTLVHTITRPNTRASPTCITPLSGNGESFVVTYADASIIIYDTRSGEELGSMLSLETYDGTMGTSVNAVVATIAGLDQPHHTTSIRIDEDDDGSVVGPTGGGRSMAGSGVEGVIISGHEDRFVRFFDANSGQCTYNMLAHPASISSLSLSPDGLELVSAGHDASLRFWSLEKRTCIQEITSHRIMRGEGVCSVVWSQDGRWIVSGGGDGIVKVFARE